MPFTLSGQFGAVPLEWDPATWGGQEWLPGVEQYAPGYLPRLLDFRELVRSGQAKDYEAEEYRQMVAEAMATPMRDVATLEAGWGTPGEADWQTKLWGGAPDLGRIALTLADKVETGQASDQERTLYTDVVRMMRDQDYRASVPQASDAFTIWGNDLFGPLATLALGATGGLAAAPLAAGGATLATTLGSLGTLAGVAGTGAGIIGGATDQDWLSKLGLGLGIAGGLAGGIGGLSNLWGRGVNSLTDAAKLASSAGKITGALGRIPGAGPLKDVSRYLGYAGQAGNLGAGLGADDWLGWGGSGEGSGQWGGGSGQWAVGSGEWGVGSGVSGSSPTAYSLLPTPSPGVSQLLSAADVATQRGGGGMEWDYSNDWGASVPYDDWSWDAGATSGGFTPDYSYDYGGQQPYDNWSGSGGAGGLSLEDQVKQAIAGRPDLYGSASSPMSGLASVLGSIGSFLGNNASWLGPAASTLGSLGAGAIGQGAASNAARLQAAALNRGIDLQTAQWLQQQGNLAPYLQAGQQGLMQLQQLAGRAQPRQPGLQAAIDPRAYGMPGATPTWAPAQYFGPQAVQAGDFAWTPGQGPRAQDYRYTPGALPGAADYRYTPGPVPTLSGQELLANDPGVQFRLDEGRKALEASALARGTGMSGATLAALQRQGQELSSQEYGSAWNRAREQAQLREQWGQAASQLGWGQAEAAARLREQVTQLASQQGWSQAQAEAAFREQLAQQASQQGFTQALAGQGQQWQQGFASEQDRQRQQQAFDETYYNRVLHQNQLIYGRDVTQQQTDYDRQQALYRQQLAQHLLPWEQQSTLATLGGQATGMYGQQGQSATNAIANLLGQLGTAQAGGTLGGANSWLNALSNVGGAVQGGLANQQLLSVLASLNR